MAMIKFTSQAYCKLIMHVAKYPHCAVNGVLLTDKQSKNGDTIFIDAVPLFHVSLGLSPMYEVALEQIDKYCQTRDYRIAGYYHANEHHKDRSPNHVALQLCERIGDRTGKIHLVMVNSELLNVNMTEPAVSVLQVEHDSYTTVDSSRVGMVGESDCDVCHIASCLVQMRSYRSLIDFDNHLDDITLDWRNSELEAIIESTF